MGPISGMGFDIKLLDEFLNKKNSSRDLETKKNYYLLKLIHSVYNHILKNNKKTKVKEKSSILGK